MKQRIHDYISYQFRNIEKTKEVQEAMEEAYLNLMDLYQSFLDKGETKETAYIHAIENLGDFQSTFGNALETEEEYPFRPSWSEASMVGGLIASIFSVPMIFIHNIWGFLFLFMGLIGFFVPAYFYFKHARFVLEEKKDVLYHNQTLKKIFSFYLYQSLAWIISISLLITSAITNIVTQGILFLVVSTSEEQFTFTDIDHFLVSIFVGAMLFLLIFIIMLLLMRKAHQKVYTKYIDLTGDTTTKHPMHSLYKAGDTKNVIKITQILLSGTLLLLYVFPAVELRIGNIVSPNLDYYSVYSIAFGNILYSGNPAHALFVFLSIFLIISYLMSWKKNKQIWDVLATVTNVLMIIIIALVQPILEASPGVLFLGVTRIYYYIFFSTIVLFVLGLYQYFKKNKRINKE